MDKSFSATPAACLPTARLILDRLLPAVLFGTMTFSSLSKLARLWLTPVDPGFETSLLHMLALGHELLTLAFLALLTVLFVVRRTPLSARADPVAMVIAKSCWRSSHRRRRRSCAPPPSGRASSQPSKVPSSTA